MEQVNFVAIAAISLSLVACGTVANSSGPMQLGPDTYRISARASMGNQTESQKMALNEAKAYCSSLNRELMVTATEDAKDFGPFLVTFRCLNSGDRDLYRPTLEKSPDTVIKIK